MKWTRRVVIWLPAALLDRRDDVRRYVAVNLRGAWRECEIELLPGVCVDHLQVNAGYYDGGTMPRRWAVELSRDIRDGIVAEYKLISEGGN